MSITGARSPVRARRPMAVQPPGAAGGTAIADESQVACEGSDGLRPGRGPRRGLTRERHARDPVGDGRDGRQRELVMGLAALDVEHVRRQGPPPCARGRDAALDGRANRAEQPGCPGAQSAGPGLTNAVHVVLRRPQEFRALRILRLLPPELGDATSQAPAHGNAPLSRAQERWACDTARWHYWMAKKREAGPTRPRSPSAVPLAWSGQRRGPQRRPPPAAGTPRAKGPAASHTASSPSTSTALPRRPPTSRTRHLART